MATTLRGTQAPMASRVAGTTMPRSRPTALLEAAVTVLRTQPTTHLVAVAAIALLVVEEAVAAIVAEAPVATAAVTHAKRTLGLRYPAPTKRGWAASPARNFNSATIVDLYRVYCMAQAKVIGYSAKRKFLPISRFIFPGTR